MLDVQTRAVKAILRDLPAGTVLDMGGGHGQLVDLLQDAGWRVTVHGSDSACETNLRNLHGKTGCDFMQGDLLSLPLQDQSFDLVIAVRLLSHVDDWRRLLAEMCRVARRTVVTDYPGKFALNALTPLLFGLKKSLEGNTRTYSSFSRQELATEFSLHGLGSTRQVKQFFLPMVIHRLGNGSWPFRAAEAACRAIGLTALAGSPVIIRADRES